MRTIVVTPRFEKDARSVPPLVRESADVLLPILQRYPTHPRLGARKLVNIRPAAYRIKIGRYRLVYTFTATDLILLRFRHRKDIYKGL